MLEEARRLNMVDGHFVWIWIDTVPSNVTLESNKPDTTEKTPEGKRDKRNTQNIDFDEYIPLNIEENDLGRRKDEYIEGKYQEDTQKGSKFTSSTRKDNLKQSSATKKEGEPEKDRHFGGTGSNLKLEHLEVPNEIQIEGKYQKNGLEGSKLNNSTRKEQTPFPATKNERDKVKILTSTVGNLELGSKGSSNGDKIEYNTLKNNEKIQGNDISKKEIVSKKRDILTAKNEENHPTLDGSEEKGSNNWNETQNKNLKSNEVLKKYGNKDRLEISGSLIKNRRSNTFRRIPSRRVARKTNEIRRENFLEERNNIDNNNSWSEIGLPEAFQVEQSALSYNSANNFTDIETSNIYKPNLVPFRPKREIFFDKDFIKNDLSDMHANFLVKNDKFLFFNRQNEHSKLKSIRDSLLQAKREQWKLSSFFENRNNSPELPAGLLSLRAWPIKVDRHLVKGAVKLLVGTLRTVLNSMPASLAQNMAEEDLSSSCWDAPSKGEFNFSIIFAR